MNDECTNCKLEYMHGGSCSGRDNCTPCISYTPDSRGHLLQRKTSMYISQNEPIPKIGTWYDCYNISQLKKEVRFDKIIPIAWSIRDGKKGILCDVVFTFWSHQNGEIWWNQYWLEYIGTVNKY